MPSPTPIVHQRASARNGPATARRRSTSRCVPYHVRSGQVRSKGMHGIHTLQWLQGEEPRWILVVEKEGVFHRLVEENFSEYVVVAYK